MEGSCLQTDQAQFGKVPVVIHVEACLADGVICADYAALTESIRQHIFRKGVVCSGATLNGALLVDLGDNAELSQLKYLCICERDTGSLQPFYFKGTETIVVHIFKLFEQFEFQIEEYDAMTESPNEPPPFNRTILPSDTYVGLWESLVFDTPIKEELLDYVATSLLFADKRVNCQVISWNRIILFYGPPGTGKTSICKALAQKLAIRLSNRYSHGQLIEVNAHGLMSKFFSESGKLVVKLFDKIRDLVANQNCFVCVLIDEVESLTAARKCALNGQEPSDAIRVVNALLTQIDSLKKHSNVIIMATSNITDAIDEAFVDRADIKQFIGLPSANACYTILRTALEELMRVGVIAPRQVFFDYKTSVLLQNDVNRLSVVLLQVANACQGFSGRTIRKLPFLAHALYLKTPVSSPAEFLWALKLTAEKQQEQMRRIQGGGA